MIRDAEPGADAADAGSAAPPGPVAAIELALADADLLALAHLPGLTRQGPSRPANLVWHDNADFALALQRLSLLRDGRVWRLERLAPGADADWPAAIPAPVLDENASPALLSPAPPLDCAPVAAFAGRRRAYALHGCSMQVLYGTLRGAAGGRKACLLALAGPADRLLATAVALAADLRVAVPRGTLGAEAMAAARGRAAAPRHLGAPAVGGDVALGDGLAAVLSHLLDVLLHWADSCREAAEPDAVHQARVATRRLRSALSIYKRVAACPELDGLRAGLRDCAARLGAARDWDVFLEGAGARLAQAGPDPRIALLLRTAQRRRNEAYAELRLYLASPDFRRLEIALGCASALRPWERTVEPALLGRDTAAFAAEILERRWRRVRKAGRGLAELPVPALHELRKDCKRLRYAAEFFGPGFPKRASKAFGKRLATLQEQLGTLNDAAVAQALLTQLGRAGRGYAGGMVEGWAGAGAEPARERVAKAWKRFRAEPAFWRT